MKKFRRIRIQLDFVLLLDHEIDDLPQDLPNIAHHFYTTPNPRVVQALAKALDFKHEEFIIDKGALATVTLDGRKTKT